MIPWQVTQDTSHYYLVHFQHRIFVIHTFDYHDDNNSAFNTVYNMTSSALKSNLPPTGHC